MNGWPTTPVEITTDVEELQNLKRQFASELLFTPDDSFKAALRVFGNDGSKALYASSHWPMDDFVKSEMSRLLNENGMAHYLPNKSQIAREVIDIARKEVSSAGKYAGYKLYCDIMGFMPERSGNGSGNQTNIFMGANKVMQVVNHGTDDEWSAKAIASQKALQASAMNDVNND